MRNIVIFIMLSAIITGGFILLSECNVPNKIEDALKQIADSGEASTLQSATDFNWDKVYIIGPYQGFDCSCVQRIPKRVKGIIRSQELSKSSAVLIFSLDGRFVNYSCVDYFWIDKMGLQGGIYAPNTIINEIEDRHI